MQTVTSKDGTTIAFDKVGSGPAVIMVNGAMAYRAFDPSIAHLAELLGKRFCQNSNPTLAERPHFWYTDPIHSME
jgi:hypothetical protein